MNKTWLIFGGVGVVVVGIAVYVVSSSSTASTEQAPATVSATATTLKKGLSVTPAGNSVAVDIATSSQVSQGDYLATSHEGRGLVTMANGSTVVLDYDSSMTIENLDAPGTHTGLSVAAGSAWARVEKVFGQGEYFEIKTKNAVAVVRGTSFGVTFHPDGSTTALVSAGTVTLTPIDAVTGKLLEYKTLTVSAGNKGMVFANGSTSESPLNTSDQSSEWFKYNNGDASQTTTSTVPVKTLPATQTALPSTPVPQPTQLTQPVTNPTSLPAAQTVSGATATNPCAVSETGSALNTSALKLLAVSPSSVSQRSGSVVTLTGVGFTCATTITAGSKVLDGETGFSVVNDSTIRISSTLLPTGTLDLTIADTLGGTAALARAITVTP